MERSRNPIAAFLREPLTVAVLAALVIAGMLAVVVLSLWSGPGGAGPAVVQLPAPTPTPRAVRRAVSTPSASLDLATPTDLLSPHEAEIVIGASASPTPAASNGTLNQTSDARYEPTATPAPTMTPAPTSAPSPTAPPTPETLFGATTGAQIAELAAGRWQADGDTLVLPQPALVAESWLTLPATASEGPVTLQARVRVTAVSSGVCNQSFGLVVEQGGEARGGGEFFPCESTEPIFRLTDVTNWNDGYDQDPTLATAPSGVSNEWRAIAITVDGDEISLSIDGEEVARATDPALRAGSGDYSFGIWSQGVELEIQQIFVTGV